MVNICKKIVNYAINYAGNRTGTWQIFISGIAIWIIIFNITAKKKQNISMSMGIESAVWLPAELPAIWTRSMGLAGIKFINESFTKQQQEKHTATIKFFLGKFYLLLISSPSYPLQKIISKHKLEIIISYERSKPTNNKTSKTEIGEKKQ